MQQRTDVSFIYFLQVKLTNQETELVGLLKKIPLGPAEVAIVRDHAQMLRDGTLKSRGEALLPIMLASFIFDVLVSPTNSNGGYFFVLYFSVCSTVKKLVFHF